MGDSLSRSRGSGHPAFSAAARVPMLLGMDGLTVLVVAEGLSLAQNLAIVFRRNASVTVLGPAFDARAANDPLLSGSIDVVVVDLGRSDGEGLALIRELAATASVPVVASTDEMDAHLGAEVLAAGGAGMIPKGIDGRAAFDALSLAAGGGIAMPDDQLSSVVERIHSAHGERRMLGVSTLTAREREVLALLGEGLSMGEIATGLGITASTVQAHVKGVFTKLGVHSQVEAIRIAWRAGLAKVPASA